MGAIRIRDATAADVNRVVELLMQLFATESSGESAVNESVARTVFNELINSKGVALGRVLLAVSDKTNSVVGMAAFSYVRNMHIGQEAILDDLIVDETGRGQRVGEKLIAEFL